jgi:SulP family sulfate permease
VATPPDDAVTVLGVDGSLFYAGAWTLERMLPSPRGATRPVVALRLRGRTQVGATFVDLVARYAAQLAEARGHLYLSGVHPRVCEQLRRSGKVDAAGPLGFYPGTEIIGESSRRAAADATAWLVARRPEAIPQGTDGPDEPGGDPGGAGAESRAPPGDQGRDARVVQEEPPSGPGQG